MLGLYVNYDISGHPQCSIEDLNLLHAGTTANVWRSTALTLRYAYHYGMF
jgi:hypothetical protein